MAIVNGTNNEDALGYADGVTDDADTIFGFGGMDLIYGYGGDDVILGGNDNDIIMGGFQADDIDGGAGNDTARYDDSYVGVIVSLITGTGTGGSAQGDTLVSIENLSGSAHQDLLIGDDNNNRLSGYTDADILKGGGGEDTLNGGDGIDGLDGGAGNDTMRGGLGNDTFFVDSAGDVVVEATNEGTDTVKTSVSYELAADANVQTLRTTDNAGASAIDLTGNSWINTLVGNAGVNILDGKGGADFMHGLDGNDTYFVNHAGDDVYEAANKGGDTVRVTVNYQLTAGQEVEALTTTNNNSVGAINLTGNGNAQVIVGNAGVNILQGLHGSDQLQGMAGNDTLIGGAENDKFLFNTALNAATNVDTIIDMTAAADIIRLDNAIFTQAGAVGTLDADAFHIGAAAADAQDRIVYNSATGDLFYDADGTGVGAQTLFAKLTTGLALTNADFAIV